MRVAFARARCAEGERLTPAPPRSDTSNDHVTEIVRALNRDRDHHNRIEPDSDQTQHWQRPQSDDQNQRKRRVQAAESDDATCTERHQHPGRALVQP